MHFILFLSHFIYNSSSPRVPLHALHCVVLKTKVFFLNSALQLYFRHATVLTPLLSWLVFAKTFWDYILYNSDFHLSLVLLFFKQLIWACQVVFSCQLFGLPFFFRVLFLISQKTGEDKIWKNFVFYDCSIYDIFTMIMWKTYFKQAIKRNLAFLSVDSFPWLFTDWLWEKISFFLRGLRPLCT